ncbi:MAG: hypothetical protein GY751_05185, partial [Bacteroidetes bacterium]|nr:hypothetical protein [Bacteroidota bacterium]
MKKMNCSHIRLSSVSYLVILAFLSFYLIPLTGSAQYDVAVNCGAFMDIEATGAALGLSDDGEADAQVPFDFEYFGVNYTAPIDVTIGNNGGMIWNQAGASLSFSNGSLPSGSWDAAILPFWDDLDSETGDVYWQVMGTAPNRTFIVQWERRPHFSGSTNTDPATFQLQLFEGSNAITFYYEDVDFTGTAYDDGASATVGFQGLDGFGVTVFEEFSYDAPALADGFSICYTVSGAVGPTGNCAPPTDVITNVNCNGAVDIDWTANNGPDDQFHAWNVEIGVTGFNVGAGEEVLAFTNVGVVGGTLPAGFVLGNLAPGTCYDVYVSEHCDVND